jgi:eukaryotic-like serine/threonine-protein kinase
MHATAPSSSELEPTLEVGQLLEGKYRVEYLVGQGGMAAVWAGTNERAGKRVALKVLLPSLAAIPGVDALFQREALAASRVNHPNVVTVFDVLEHDRMACIVMELLDGEPLGNYLATKGPLHPNDACSLLVPAMRGVAAAHAQGVVHRDIKPQNIFVCLDPNGRALTTKVLDFGISIVVGRAREPAAGPAASLPMGTPVYMSPEHILGESPVDVRADVYGFGVLFFEALTGQVPFPGEPGAELYARILSDPIPPLAQLRPDVPAGLVRIIETALAKEPAQRHNCVHRMIDAIEEEMASRPLSAPGASPRLALLPGGSGDLGAPGKPPSGEHQRTRFMVGFPLAVEREPRQETTHVVAPALPARPPTPALVAARTSRVVRSRRSGVWAASLLLLLAGIGAAWRGFAYRAPPLDAGPPAAAPARVSVAPSVAPLAPAAEAADRIEPVSDPTAGAPPAASVAPAAANDGRPSATGHRPTQQRSDGRGARGHAARLPSPPGAAAALPRAGRLSVEDF